MFANLSLLGKAVPSGLTTVAGAAAGLYYWDSVVDDQCRLGASNLTMKCLKIGSVQLEQEGVMIAGSAAGFLIGLAVTAFMAHSQVG